MNITFFIGNGFDLGVGLKTKYTDFYKSYINDKTQSDLLVSMIKENYETWSDLETTLGECLNEIEYKDRDEFLESKYNLEIALAEYLEMQENLIDYKSHEEMIIDSFSNTLNTFVDNLPRTEKEKVMNTILNMQHETLQFLFITFNYTCVLDKCINILKNNSKLLKPYYGDKVPVIGSINHIHGTTNSEMILGVNDESQISSLEFANDLEFNEMMIKYRLNTSIAQDKIRIVEQTINSSSVVVIYGMSIGYTDIYWWKYIANWLNASGLRKLIICTYDDEDNKRKHPYRTIQARNRIMNMFFERAQINEKLKEKLKEQIFIVRNPKNMFSVNLVDNDHFDEIMNEVAISEDIGQ